jgi:predicted PurR-regulated permease PerM
MVSCLLVVLFWGISEARPFLIPISISALLAFTMAPFVRAMKKLHLPEWFAIVSSSIMLIFPFLAFAYVLVWQGQALIRDFPAIMDGLNKTVAAMVQSDFGRSFHLSSEFNQELFLQKFEVSISQGIQFAMTGIGAVLGAGSQLALVLLFSILMLASRKHIRRCSEKIFVQSEEMGSPNLLDEAIVLIERFLLARLLIVIIVGAVDIFILGIFKIDYAFLLGGFLGVMTLVPAIGFLMGAAPVVIVALAMRSSFLHLLATFVALLFVSFIESNVLTPKMVGKRLNINALATFIGLFAGGLLWGVWGMFLSIPVLGVLRIAFNAAPSLRPWGELLAEKDDKLIPLKVKASKKNKVA